MHKNLARALLCAILATGLALQAPALMSASR